MKKRQAKIYESRRQLALTLFFIILPFVFILLFSRVVHIATPSLFAAILISVLRLAVAYATAAFLGLFFAILFHRGRLSKFTLPLFDVLQSFPTFAALPLATFLWGVSGVTVVIFLVITIIWPIFFSTVSSLKLVRRDWEEVADMAGLSGTLYVKKFLWPASIPGFITGSIIGLGEGWEALVATEIIVGVKSGVGEFFELFSHNAPVTIFGIIGFLILIFSINKLIWLPLLEKSHLLMEE